MNAEIIAIGSELLLGETIDTNSAYLARQMASIGVGLFRKTVIGDNEERIAAAIGEALGRADEAERAWLQSTVAPPCGASRSSLRVVDLFSGCGGLSIGLAEAARALNRSFEPVLAVDVDQVAADTYAANFPTADRWRVMAPSRPPNCRRAVAAAIPAAPRMCAAACTHAKAARIAGHSVAVASSPRPISPLSRFSSLGAPLFPRPGRGSA